MCETFFALPQEKRRNNTGVSKQTWGCIMLLSWQHKTNNQQINISAVSQIMLEKGDKMCIISEKKMPATITYSHRLFTLIKILQNILTMCIHNGIIPFLFCLSYCLRLWEAYSISNCSENIGYMHMDFIEIIISVHKWELNPITTCWWGSRMICM